MHKFLTFPNGAPIPHNNNNDEDAKEVVIELAAIYKILFEAIYLLNLHAENKDEGNLEKDELDSIYNQAFNKFLLAADSLRKLVVPPKEE
jgi:hypothetical protein